MRKTIEEFLDESYVPLDVEEIVRRYPLHCLRNWPLVAESSELKCPHCGDFIEVTEECNKFKNSVGHIQRWSLALSHIYKHHPELIVEDMLEDAYQS